MICTDKGTGQLEGRRYVGPTHSVEERKAPKSPNLEDDAVGLNGERTEMLTPLIETVLMASQRNKQVIRACVCEYWTGSHN